MVERGFKYRILLVDDDPVIRETSALVLNKKGFEVRTSEDGFAALVDLRSALPDLIICDLRMPNMSGFELCTKIRTLPQYAKTPVVFVTGLNDLESRANSTMSGGNDFIAKPFLFIELTLKALMLVLRSRLMTVKK